jgi:hypothetical protein
MPQGRKGHSYSPSTRRRTCFSTRETCCFEWFRGCVHAFVSRVFGACTRMCHMGDSLKWMPKQTQGPTEAFVARSTTCVFSLDACAGDAPGRAGTVHAQSFAHERQTRADSDSHRPQPPQLRSRRQRERQQPQRRGHLLPGLASLCCSAVWRLWLLVRILLLFGSAIL